MVNYMDVKQTNNVNTKVYRYVLWFRAGHYITAGNLHQAEPRLNPDPYVHKAQLASWFNLFCVDFQSLMHIVVTSKSCRNILPEQADVTGDKMFPSSSASRHSFVVVLVILFSVLGIHNLLHEHHFLYIWLFFPYHSVGHWMLLLWLFFTLTYRAPCFIK